jgi:hypothetical protein
MVISVIRIDGPQGAETAGTTPGSLKLHLAGDAAAEIRFAASVRPGSTLLVTLRSGESTSQGVLRFN